MSKQERIYEQPKKHYANHEEPIDPMPESIYDEELAALTKLVLEHCEEELDD